MKQLLKNILLFIFFLNVGFLSSCNETSGNEIDDIKLVSTNPEENEIVNASTESLSFVFDRGIYIVDKTKITLNNNPILEASVYGTNLKIKTEALESGIDYTLLIDKGAIRDGNNYLNNEVFSLKFQTKEAPVNASSVSQHGFLSVKGTALMDQHGKEIILRGVSFGWHNWWPRFYNENAVTWLKEDWKCAVVRAAIGAEPAGGYIDNPTLALNCLYTVIDAAIKNDMYVIVDWHSHNIRLEEAKEFFIQVAEKYKDYPNIIYEIFNEPEYQSWQEVKTYSEEIIGTIRSIDKKNIILVGSPHWDQDIDKVAADPITGYDNLMYTLHFYAATHKQELRNKGTEALKKGLPLFISECAGMEATGDGAIDSKEWQLWLDWMNENHISWIAWSISDKNETCSMIKNTSSPASNWNETDLKEWGQIVRSELQK